MNQPITNVDTNMPQSSLSIQTAKQFEVAPTWSACQECLISEHWIDRYFFVISLCCSRCMLGYYSEIYTYLTA